MRKRLIVFFMSLALFVTGSCVSVVHIHAEDSGEDIDISNIWTEGSLVGYSQAQTRGIYLFDGMSVINDAGGGKIGAGGITNAALRCTVSVNVIVERKEDGSWVRETSWSATKTNALTVGTDKELSVDSGYYYRCRSVHRASSDVSNSCTDALWM